jgi:predicted phosphodiesterase
MKRAIIAPDTHFPLHDQAAVNCVLKAIKMVKPSIFIHLGDLGEWESVSGWKYKRRKRPPLEYILPEIEKDIEAVNDGLDQFDKVLDSVKCEERYLLEGNHDVWCNQFVDEHPYLKEIQFPNALRLKERGYIYKPYGKYLKIGKLYFYHGGHYSTVYHARQHALNLGKSVVYGHIHDIQRHSVTHLDGAHAGFSLGCLKDMSDEANTWLRNRKTSWGHAFGVVDWFANNDFRLDVVDITKGKTILWGDEIDGNV